jgi:hypothetical protein
MSNGTMGNSVDEQIQEVQENARFECQHLLDSARFSTLRDSHLRGSLAGVSILVRPDRVQPDTCRIDVICQSAGQLRVGWERIPLELVDTEEDQVIARGVLDSGGRARFTLPYGSRERSLRFRDPVVVLEVPALAFAFQGQPEGAPHLESSKKSERLSIDYTIVGSIPGQRTLKIVVEALDHSLRGGTVRVEIRSPRGRQSQDVELVSNDGLRGEWEIREELLGTGEPEDLKIEARPLG